MPEGAELRSVRRPGLSARLSLIFLFSGAAALLFETLWFRLAGLTFGNTAWASALVLTSFMSGLAAGNLLAARMTPRNALRLYALLEAGIAVTAFALVLALPFTQDLFAPVFRAFAASDFSLNAARLVLAFALLSIPTTLMGATLPTVVGTLTRSEKNYGRALGLLYGWNTMGAVAGALAGELLLIRLFGLRGTGLIAAALSATASVIALTVRVDVHEADSAKVVARTPRLTALLAAASLSGFALLALEVIWFRFVVLFIFASSLAFAIMLAVVLLGISLGALAASVILRRSPDADRWAGLVAAACGVILIVSYATFQPAPLGHPGSFAPGDEQRAVLFDSLLLMLPVSLLSGLLFTFVGRAVESELQNATRAAAMMTAFNTIGAAMGSAAAGFLLIPRIGIERSFFAIGVVYAIVALLLLPRGRPFLASAAAAVVLLASLAFFPFGLFRSRFLPLAARDYLSDASIAAVREGVIETAVYLRTSVAGEPYAYRLFTNGYSMSGTALPSKRYMTMFTYLPLALNPRAKNALLISYGVGITATSLVGSPQLQSIDVVDISRDILEMGEIVWPGPSNPLRNPRVRVHVEDGRFFLRTTNRRFDLITAEPPPPKSAGVVSLYTLEHFRLLRDRLSEGGVASYWLPVYQLDVADARAIVSAFCGAFDDCSLWSGAGLEWVLVGTRGRQGTPASAGFSHQWEEPAAGTWLRWVGLETPEQLAATFLADADGLKRFAGAAPPLTDDRPLRLKPAIGGGHLPEYDAMLGKAHQEFLSSSFVRQAIPPDIRERAAGYFGTQGLVDLRFNATGYSVDPRVLYAILKGTPMRFVPRILLRSDMWIEQIARRALARGAGDRDLLYVVAVGELSDRHYASAAQLFGRLADSGAREAVPYAILASALAGNRQEAQDRIAQQRGRSEWGSAERWRWLPAN